MSLIPIKGVRAWHVALCAPFLPLLILLIPDAFCVPLDPGRCPWYWMLTIVPATMSVFYLYPVTLATTIAGAEPLSLTWVVFCIAYASVISFGMFLFVRRRESRSKENRPRDER